MKNGANGSKSGCWLIYIASFFVTLLTVLVIILIELGSPSMTDERDDRRYKTVQIGSQTWMAENLNYKTKNSKCYGGSLKNCQKYGRLYNWNDAVNACPSGWHLPTKNEYEKLIEFAGGTQIDKHTIEHLMTQEVNKTDKISKTEKNLLLTFLPLLNLTDIIVWNHAGRMLTSRRGWHKGGGIDKYDFSALPAGQMEDESYTDIGEVAYFWTRSTYSFFWIQVPYMVSFWGEDDSMNGIDGLALMTPYDESSFYSVRCVKN